ncbi:calcitonin receptor, partial [Biomphalaria glabrata]
QLRKQHRIHIHLNLFVSFTLTNCVWLTWDHLIFKDRLENPREVAIMHQHIIGCRVLYMMSRVSWTCNIAWMSLEGFHLHRLISQAFQTPKTISSYYFIGWVFPLLPTGIYALVRFLSSNQGCWVSHAGYYEWIIYSPNILCILVSDMSRPMFRAHVSSC